MKYLKKLQALAIRNRWSGCLYQVVFHIHQLKDVDPDKTSEAEFRCSLFDKESVKNRGAAYHRTTVPKLMKQIEQKSEGTIQVIEDYHHGIYKILVHPIWFLDEKKSSSSENRLSSNSVNPMFSEEHKKKVLEQQQQDLDALDSLFQKIGMKYSPKALLNIWRTAGKKIDEVKDAIAFMLHCNQNQAEPIRNAHGWLISCLRFGDHHDFAHQLIYQLPKFDNRLELMTYINCHLNGDPVPIPSQ